MILLNPLTHTHYIMCLSDVPSPIFSCLGLGRRQRPPLQNIHRLNADSQPIANAGGPCLTPVSVTVTVIIIMWTYIYRYIYLITSHSRTHRVASYSRRFRLRRWVSVGFQASGARVHEHGAHSKKVGARLPRRTAAGQLPRFSRRFSERFRACDLMCWVAGRVESTGCVTSGRRWHRRIPSSRFTIPARPFPCFTSGQLTANRLTEEGGSW